MRVHIVKQGDTIWSIAEKYLYQSARAADIYQINNLSSNIVYVGQSLKIPDLFEETVIKPLFAGAGLIIAGQEIKAIPPIKIVNAYDAMAGTFDFMLPNEDVYNDISKPYSYPSVDIYFENDLLLSGVALNAGSCSLSTLNFSGLGKAGILQKVNCPQNITRTFYQTSLKTIAEKMCNPFALVVDIDSNALSLANTPFDKAEIAPDEFISTFLTSLARQRGLILSCTPEGALRISLNSTVGLQPVLNITDPETDIIFNADEVYSDYTALRAANTRHAAAMGKSQLPFIPIFRHNVLQQTERVSESIGDFLKAEIIKSLLSSFSLSINLPYIKPKDGKVFAPNQIITIESKKHKIIRPTDFLIRKATIEMKTTGESASLDLIPLDWYNGTFTEFWK